MMSGWFIIIVVALILFLLPLAIAGLSAAPWVPTKKKDIKRIINLIEVKSGAVVYDLGCGDARVLIELANKQKIQGIGLDLSWLQVLHAKINVLLKKHNKQIKIKLKSFYAENLSQADLVFIFLMPKVLDKVGKKFLAELKPGSQVISAVWPIPNFEKYLVTESKPDKEKDLSFYFYEIK